MYYQPNNSKSVLKKSMFRFGTSEYQSESVHWDLKHCYQD